MGREAAGIWASLRRTDPMASVKLDVAPRVPFQYAVSALDACRRAGVPSIEFAASARVQAELQDRPDAGGRRDSDRGRAPQAR